MYVSHAIFADIQKNDIVPVELSCLIRDSVKSNKKNFIKSILVYKGNHYLQVIEGCESQVDNLFSKIINDERHKDITILLNTPIAGKIFNKPLQCIVDMNDEKILYFLRRYQHVLDQLKPIERKKLDIFYNLSYLKKENTEQFISFDGNFNGKIIQLAKWPDIDASVTNMEEIELCSILVKHPKSYEYVRDKIFSSNEVMLCDLLNKYNELSILKIAKNQNDHVSTNSMGGKTPKENKNFFYQLLKNILIKR